LFAGLLILPAVRAPRWNWKLIPMAATFAAMCFTFLSAMSLTTAANTIWLQCTAPWWIFIIGTLFLKVPAVRRDMVTLSVGAVGVGLILFHEARGEAQLGVALGLFSAVFYAGVVFFLRSLRNEDTAWLIVVNLFTTAVIAAPWALASGIWPAGWQWPLLISFGFFQMSLPYVLFGRGLRGISSQEAALLGLLEPVLLPCWAWLVRGETPAWWTFAGAGFILFGLALRYLPRRGPAQ
jgi:drug/metabolite transporter (DMT)-like permease